MEHVKGFVRSAALSHGQDKKMVHFTTVKTKKTQKQDRRGRGGTPKKSVTSSASFRHLQAKRKSKKYFASQCVHRPWLRDGGEAESGGRVPLGGVLGSIRGNFLQGLVHRLRNLGLGGVKVDDDLAKGLTHAHEEVCEHRGLQGGKWILFGER